jgi:lactoylglutathione lyase
MNASEQDAPAGRSVNVTQLFPILSTNDLPRLLGFYRDRLGGTVTYEFPGPDGEPAYVGLDIGSSHMGIGRDPEGSAPEGRQRFSLWVYVDDCDAAVDALRAAGVTVVEPPADQPWGERVARVRDPDGNDVIIGAESPS